MWIDAHHHLWDPVARPQPWMEPNWPINRRFGVDDLRAAVASTPVGATIVVQTTSSLDETGELLDVAAASPVVVGVVGWLDLQTDIGAQLDRLTAAHRTDGLVGVRHQAEDEPDPEWLSRPAVVAAVTELGRRGLAFDVLVRPHQLPAAIALARAVEPATRLVLDHCAKPPVGGDLDDWASLIRDLASLENVACKLSGLVTEADWQHWTTGDLAPIARTVLECFGPQRTMFGSDWPVCLLAASYDQVAAAAAALTAGLSEHERESVFADTARAWYRLAQ